jgi:hypothetical protein
VTTDHTGGPWLFSDPRRSHPHHPVIDEHSAAVVADAAVTLTLLRSPMRLGDHLADLHATVSLLAQIHARLPTVVAAARDQGHPWTDIANQLGVTPAAARRRYRPEPTTAKKAR